MRRINKRGDVPTALIFVVAIALCLLSIFVFLTLNSNRVEDSGQRNLLMSTINLNEHYVKELLKFSAKEAIMDESEDKSSRFKEIVDKNNPSIIGMGNVFGKMRDNDFNFEKIANSNGGGYYYKLRVQGLFVSASAGENKIKRNFDVCMIFDAEGEFRGNCQEE